MFLVVCGLHTCAAYSKTGRMDDLYTNDLTKEEQPQSEWRNKFNYLVALAAIIWRWSVQFSVEFRWIPKYLTIDFQDIGESSIQYV